MVAVTVLPDTIGWRETSPADASTVTRVLIAVLLVSDTIVDKLAAHQIRPEEVRQVSDGDRIVIRNPRPRVKGSVLMIGSTHATDPHRRAEPGSHR